MTDYSSKPARLGFRICWNRSDSELARGLWGDPEVTRLIGGPFSAEQVQQRLEREIATQKAHGIQYWPIFLLATDEHVGCCGLRPYKPEDGIYEIGFHICKAHWGAGYATEAARAVMAYAFATRTFGAAGLFAGHNPANANSQRLLLKLGFHYTHDEYYAPTGLQHPSYLLTAEQFNEMKT
ncbi:MAG: GNAT family N-acetyltransferase [Anaerolineae bacterium]